MKIKKTTDHSVPKQNRVSRLSQLGLTTVEVLSDKFTAAVLLLVILLLLFRADLGALSLVVYMAAVGCMLYYLFKQNLRGREILFRAHIEDDSKLQFWKKRVAFILIVSSVVAALLAFSLWLFVHVAHWTVMLGMVPLMLLLPRVRRFWSIRLNTHLKRQSREFAMHVLSTSTLGLLVLFGLILAKWLQLSFFISEEVLRGPDRMASSVIDRVNHGFTPFQDVARTMAMFELQLARAHQLAEGRIRHGIFVYFLLPSTMVAFSLPILFTGIYDLLNRKSSNDES